MTVTGLTATFVIRWEQTEIDGRAGPERPAVRSGATWRWSGVSRRIDGPDHLVLSSDARDVLQMRRRASKAVRRLLLGEIEISDPCVLLEEDDPLFDEGFVVTDGRRCFAATFVERRDGAALLSFVGQMPPAETDLWIVRILGQDAPVRRTTDFGGGVICFTHDTQIDTPQGRRPVQDIAEGDLVLTKDNGPQRVLWRGFRRMTGARLYAMPELRPIRIRAGALDSGRPESDLWVSPQHRMLVQGPVARALFNTDEVLVAAEHLVNDHSICTDYAVPEVTYHHLMFGAHQILWANGLETESFHPAHTTLRTLDSRQCARLLDRFPELAEDLRSYGDTARRDLHRSEAAILTHAMGGR